MTLIGAGTTTLPLGKKPFVPEKSKAELQCEANGGKWDAANNTCIMPDKKPEPEPKPEPVKEPEKERFGVIGTPGRGGKLSFRMPDGTLYTGLNTDDIESLQQTADIQTEAQQKEAEFQQSQKAIEIEQQQQILQQTGQPVRRELDPTLQTGERFPVVGPLLIKTRKLLGLSAKSNSVLDLITGKAKDEEFFELQPEELKTVALSQIERNEIEKGLTDSEKFGSWVEGLSLGGMSNFIAEKPSENVQTMLRRIKVAKTEATNTEMKVKDGTYTRSYGESEIDRIENKIQSFESRIKMLIQDSPELKFDSDGVNFIEDKILEARVRLFSARINIVSGETQDPSEINTLIALQESIKAEDWEI